MLGFFTIVISSYIYSRHEAEEGLPGLDIHHSQWMESYIKIELYKQGTSDIDKDLYMLMNNSIFGHKAKLNSTTLMNMSILNRSKLLMFYLYFNLLKRKYGKWCKFLYINKSFWFRSRWMIYMMIPVTIPKTTHSTAFRTDRFWVRSRMSVLDPDYRVYGPMP